MAYMSPLSALLAGLSSGVGHGISGGITEFIKDRLQEGREQKKLEVGTILNAASGLEGPNYQAFMEQQNPRLKKLGYYPEGYPAMEQTRTPPATPMEPGYIERKLSDRNLVTAQHQAPQLTGGGGQLSLPPGYNMREIPPGMTVPDTSKLVTKNEYLKPPDTIDQAMNIRGGKLLREMPPSDFGELLRGKVAPKTVLSPGDVIRAALGEAGLKIKADTLGLLKTKQDAEYGEGGFREREVGVKEDPPVRPEKDQTSANLKWFNVARNKLIELRTKALQYHDKDSVGKALNEKGHAAQREAISKSFDDDIARLEAEFNSLGGGSAAPGRGGGGGKGGKLSMREMIEEEQRKRKKLQ